MQPKTNREKVSSDDIVFDYPISSQS